MLQLEYNGQGTCIACTPEHGKDVTSKTKTKKIEGGEGKS